MWKYALLLLLVFYSCSKQEFINPEQVVKKDLITFNHNQIPAELQDVLDSHRILIFGETHYVQQHQEFVATILDNIKEDSLIYVTEIFNTFNWMVEDYFSGKIDCMPDCVNYFENYTIEAIKNLNKNGKSVQMFFMDVNHWTDNFCYSVSEVEKIIGTIVDFQNIKSMSPDSKPYKDELVRLNNKFETDKLKLIEKYGQTWYERLFQLLKYEIKSSEYRSTYNEDFREHFMVDFLLKIIEQNPGKKVIINCGGTHAQREALTGEKILRIGHYIDLEYPADNYIISFVGIKGEIKFQFYDENTTSMNLLNETKKNDLINIIGNTAKDNYSMLFFENKIFKEKMSVTYLTGHHYVLSPANQYDAIITYPEISLLNSMGSFDINKKNRRRSRR